jgi:hypothetical protein
MPDPILPHQGWSRLQKRGGIEGRVEASMVPSSLARGPEGASGGPLWRELVFHGFFLFLRFYIPRWPEALFFESVPGRSEDVKFVCSYVVLTPSIVRSLFFWAPCFAPRFCPGRGRKTGVIDLRSSSFPIAGKLSFFFLLFLPTNYRWYGVICQLTPLKQR